MFEKSLTMYKLFDMIVIEQNVLVGGRHETINNLS